MKRTTNDRYRTAVASGIKIQLARSALKSLSCSLPRFCIVQPSVWVVNPSHGIERNSTCCVTLAIGVRNASKGPG